MHVRVEEKEGARWRRWSSKSVLGAVRSSEGSTPSLLRHLLTFGSVDGVSGSSATSLAFPKSAGFE